MQVSIDFPMVNSVKSQIQVDEDTHELVAVIQLKAVVHPRDIARILNLQKQGVALYCTIGSKQAQLDLEVHTVDKNGEIDAESSKRLGSG